MDSQAFLKKYIKKGCTLVDFLDAWMTVSANHSEESDTSNISLITVLCIVCAMGVFYMLKMRLCVHGAR